MLINSDDEKKNSSWLTTPPLWLLVAALLSGQLGWAGYSVLLASIGNDGVSGLVFSFYRDLGAVPILHAAAWLLEGWRRPRGAKEWLTFAALGVCLWANQFFFLEGNFFSTADVASMFQPSVPIWTFLVSTLLRVEPPPDLRTNAGLLKVAGVLLGVIGAVTVIGASTLVGGGGVGGKHPLLGSLCLLVNTLFMALLVVGQRLAIFAPDRRAFMRHWQPAPVSVTAWYYTTATCFSALANVATLVRQPARFAIPAASAGPLVYAVLVSSCLCFAIISWASKHMHPSVVTSFWPAQVFFTIILSWLATGQSLLLLQWIAVLFLVCGLFGVSFGIFQADHESI